MVRGRWLRRYTDYFVRFNAASVGQNLSRSGCDGGHGLRIQIGFSCTVGFMECTLADNLHNFGSSLLGKLVGTYFTPAIGSIIMQFVFPNACETGGPANIPQWSVLAHWLARQFGFGGIWVSLSRSWAVASVNRPYKFLQGTGGDAHRLPQALRLQHVCLWDHFSQPFGV